MHADELIDIQGKKILKHQLTFHVVIVFQKNPKEPFMCTFSPLHIKDKSQLFGQPIFYLSHFFC